MQLRRVYDACGILRFAAHESADCLAYAEFFELQDGDFTVESLLMGHTQDGGAALPPSAQDVSRPPRAPVAPR
ncbi:MAG: hypothetical protein F4Y10_01335 [Synechococcus sp. SB0663_bin_10]|nr:hypothetical protein [Synechococcus sp. SB0663_bin_10]